MPSLEPLHRSDTGSVPPFPPAQTPAPKARSWNPALLAFAVLISGLAISTAVAWHVAQLVRADGAAHFQRYQERLLTDVTNRFTKPLYGMKGARGVFAASRSVERPEFRDYVASRDLALEFPGILGFGIIKRTARADLPAFIAREREDDDPGFAVTTGGTADDCYVITSVYPTPVNRPAWGFDIGSEPLRRAAVERSVRTGEPVLTRAITLMQDGEKSPGFLLLLPVYRNHTSPHAPTERLADLEAVVFAPIIAKDLLQGLDANGDGQVAIRVWEGDPADGGTLLHPNGGTAPSAPNFSSRLTLPLFGRELHLSIGSTPAMDARYGLQEPALVLAAGALIAALTAFLVFMLGRSREQVLAEARLMTSDLRAATLRSEAALRESTMFRSTLERHAIVSEGDAQGRITEVNAAFCAISGYARDELVGRPYRLLSSGTHPSAFFSGLWATVLAGDPWRGLICNRAKDGSPYWVDTIIAPFRDARGGVSRFVSIHVDVTARQRAAEKLHLLSERLSFALAGGNVGTWDFDVPGDRVSWDERMFSLYGIAPEAFGGTSADWRRLIHPEDRERIDGESGAALRGEREFDTQFRISWPDGAVRHIRSRAQVARDASGAPLRMTGTHWDITRERTIEAELAASVADLRSLNVLHRAILDSANLAIIATDPTGLITLWNERATALLQWTAGEMVGRRTPAAIHVPEEIAARAADASRELGMAIEPGFEAFAAVARIRGVADEREWTYVRKDGTRFPVLLSITALHDDAGALVGYLGIAADITERSRQQRELLAAKEAAEAGIRAKANFLAVMSHEIRTPMNGVIGMADLLVKTSLDAQQREYAETVRSCGESLLTLINDILDFSKLEAGRVELERIPFSLTQVIEEVMLLFTGQAEQKGVELAYRIPPGMPERLLGDPTRIRQILLNLVSNAVKFTLRGAVSMRVEELVEEDGHLRFVLAVQDTGIGMTPASIARLGEAFTQADSSTTRRFGGSGLGMTITRTLVCLMDGTLRIDSEVDRGSVFRIGLRLPIAAAAGDDPRPAGTIAGKRVLCLDDQPAGLRLMRDLCLSWGMAVETFASAQDLVLRLRTGTAPADVVLTDHEMPGIDGVMLSNLLKADPAHAHLPVVVASSDPERARHEMRLIPGGVVIDKPLRSMPLLSALQQALRPSAAGDLTDRQAQVPAIRLRRVLVAEDTKVNQRLMVLLLKKVADTVEVVDDGRQAVAAVAGNDAYDCVLMDCQMPEMDGYQATQAIRARERDLGLARLPIIALTADAMQGAREQCLAAGMDDYLSKPLRENDLHGVLARLFPDRSPRPTA